MKNALITGGTSGIGKAIAIHLHKKGYNVIASYFNNHDSANEFHKQYKIPIFHWDVSAYDECVSGIQRVVEYWGDSVDILINNAGITRDAMLHKQSYENWDIVVRSNLYSVFNMSRQVIGNMREKKWGRIISIGSVNAYGMHGQTNYSASKAGIAGFTRALALESATHNITVNTIAPGYIDTDMMASVPRDILNDKIIPKIPIGRLGRPEEIAEIAGFLASEGASLITGQVIDANGGMHM